MMRISPARSCWFFFAISFIVTSSAQGEREMVKPSRTARPGCRHQFSSAFGSNHQHRALLLARQPRERCLEPAGICPSLAACRGWGRGQRQDRASGQLPWRCCHGVSPHGVRPRGDFTLLALVSASAVCACHNTLHASAAPRPARERGAWHEIFHRGHGIQK